MNANQGGMQMNKLEGKVALVTGGGSGIGQATALAFAREGAKVVLAGRTVERGNEGAQMVKEAGGEAMFIKTDVTKAIEVEALVSRIIEAYGRLDCAFNNSGVGATGARLAKETEEAWDSIIDTNLKGVWLCMKYEIPQMIKQGGGAIINCSSTFGVGGGYRVGVYSASKHGVVGLTKSAAMDYAKDDIRVNAVCPAWIRTPMLEPMLRERPDKGEGKVAEVPLGRLGAPEEVAQAVVWLCTDAASFITGDIMIIGGGTALSAL